MQDVNVEPFGAEPPQRLVELRLHRVRPAVRRMRALAQEQKPVTNATFRHPAAEQFFAQSAAIDMRGIEYVAARFDIGVVDFIRLRVGREICGAHCQHRNLALHPRHSDALHLAAFAGSPSFLFSAIASFARRVTTFMSIVSPSRRSRVAISYLPPGFSRGSIALNRLPRQKPNSTRASSARMSSAAPFDE